VVAPSLFGTFTELVRRDERPAWFPLPEAFARSDADIEGPMEQAGRAFGYAVGPLFHWYFLLAGVCGFISAWTALAWSRENPDVRAHQWRSRLLLLALVSVLAGWPLERQVAELRVQRNQATDAYLRGDTRVAALENMRTARAAFGTWHLASLMLNFGTVILVAGGMALASQLPAGDANKPG
jgi:hypothetical protein